MKLVIGLVGEKGAGKETFGDVLMELAQKDGSTTVRQRFSDILNETLKNWGIEPNRANLQKLAQVMNAGFGEGTLTRAVRQKIQTEKADIVVLDGVRWETDEQMIKSFANHCMIYVTADTLTRYDRSRQRTSRAGEGDKTLEQFMKEEEAPNEVFIGQIGSRAEFKVDNVGSLEKLREFVSGFYNRCVKLKLLN